jgi:4-amino-4-deoxy-L-arabinose transferase-like glycosyltransferase
VRAALPLACVLLLGAALRFCALTFGAGYPHARPDETTAVGHAAAILNGELNPHFFNWPSLALYLFAAVFALARAARATLTGANEILLARAAVAFAGTLTLLTTAAIARRIDGRLTGVIAALFLAVAALHVRESHFAMTDVLMTLFLTLSIALMMRARDGGRPGAFAAAGLAGGLATSTKYSAGAIVAIAAAAPALTAAAAFLAAWGGGFVAGTPFALLDFPAFAADVAYERAHLSGGHTVLLARGWLYHLQTTLPHGLGIPLFLVAIAGVPVTAVKAGRKALVPAVFAVVFYLSMGAGRTVFFRYALPLVPLACISAAVAVTAAAEWLAARSRTPLPVVAAICAAAVAAPSFYQSLQLDRLLARPDSRVVAAEWLGPQLRPEHTLHDSGGDYTRLVFASAEFHEWRYDAATASFAHAEGRTPDWIVLYESPLPEYTAAPDSLRALARDRYDLVFRVDGARGGADGVYDRQDAFFLPIDRFSGVARPGPTVLIYRRQ